MSPEPDSRRPRRHGRHRRYQAWPTDANKDCAGIDIFRCEDDGRIVEHRDLLQVVPAESKHSNAMS